MLVYGLRVVLMIQSAAGFTGQRTEDKDECSDGGETQQGGSKGLFHASLTMI